MTKEELAKIAHEMEWNCLEGKTFDYSIFEKLTNQELKILNRLSEVEHKKAMAMLKTEHEAWLAKERQWEAEYEVWLAEQKQREANRKAHYYYNIFPIGEA